MSAAMTDHHGDNKIISLTNEHLSESEWMDWRHVCWGAVQKAAWPSPETDWDRVIREKLGLPIVLEKMPFGKYRGRLFSELPDGTVWWWATQFRPKIPTRRTGNVIFTAQVELKIRRGRPT